MVSVENRESTLLDALDIGAEVLGRAGRHGDLESLTSAIDQLDREAKMIVTSTTQSVDRCIEESISEMAALLQGEDGPLALILKRFDPSVEGNVIDVFRELVSSTAASTTKKAVAEIALTTQESLDRLAVALSTLEKISAVEEARALESQRGTAKGVEHERDAEMLLGELVGVSGDSLDDVSTVVGLDGSKKGDKVIAPRGGCLIVTEEKCSTRMSESKIRIALQDAMSNRGAQLGIMIVDSESKIPGMQPFHFIDEDKVIVVAERLSLRLVYSLFRAKSIERTNHAKEADVATMTDSLVEFSDVVERIKRALERFRLLRTEHTKASRAIAQAGKYVDETELAIAEEVVEATRMIDSIFAVQSIAAA